MKRKALFLFAFTLAILAGTAVWNTEILYPYAAFILPLDQAAANTIPELALKEKIPLGEVKGRIDHMAIDPGRRRLFVAELGNNTVGVVDIKNHKFETRLTGYDEPQGIAYIPGADTVFIANGGNGVVEMRRGEDLSLIKSIKLGDDADNIRVAGANEVIVGFGNGGLAVLDAATGEKRKDIPLSAHPESFQLDPESGRIFVNEPTALKIGVIDRNTGKEIAHWGVTAAAANFPMALDPEGHRLFVAYRIPALIAAFDTRTGKLIDRQATCGDADDVFSDSKRNRVYVICGDGSIAVLAASEHLKELSRLATRAGARTGLYAPDLDLLFVAARASGSVPAEIQIYQPRS